ncbi:hypothetical protein [Streptomyces umbrinus]|uniref:hypothetical protein n=1 Tax=Streptomyces umbrinus TaxID=67370 RepID=UPI0033D73D1F
MLDRTDYIDPADRPAAWAAMARECAARDWPRHGIANALCIDEPTVDRLLAAEGEAQPEAASRTDTACPASASETERGVDTAQDTRVL